MICVVAFSIFVPKILIIKEFIGKDVKKLRKRELLSIYLLLISSKNKGIRMNSVVKVIFLLTLLFWGNFSLLAQPIYNSCFNSLELCSNTTYNVNNIGADKTFCPDCEDDFVFCFTANNTIWFKFTTNSLGGNVQISFANLTFESNPGQDAELQAGMFSTIQPCSGNTYVQIGNCVSNATGNFTLNATALNPNTTYYLVVNGDQTGLGISSAAECTFDLVLSGTAVDRIPPAITLDASNINICKNQIVTFTAHLSNCPDSSDYLWYVNGTLVATTVDSVYQTSSLSSGDVVTVTNSCFVLCPQNVSTNSPPFSVYTVNVDAGPDEYLMTGQTVELNGSTTAPTYSWSPPFLVTNAAILDPVAIPIETTTYTLSATENGCTDFDQMVVYVEQNLVVPTTFSPNGDGINDVWEITGIEKYPNCYVRIFDRWGQEVFQKTGYTLAKAWNGQTARSNDVNESVYFYILELRDEKKQELKGSITVVR